VGGRRVERGRDNERSRRMNRMAGAQSDFERRLCMRIFVEPEERTI
jgi:hypothetical protein